MTKVFQFKTRRAKKVEVTHARIPPADKEPPVELVPIHGIMPGSKEEMYVAFALDKLGLSYHFQYRIYGGTSMRGGQILDFVVFTVPMPTILEVYGTYWHRTEKSVKDAYDQSRALEHFNGHAQYKILWDIDLQSPGMAYAAVRRELI